MTAVSRHGGLVLLLTLSALFLIANRDAYNGYFQADDLDTLSWTPTVHAGTYVSALLNPKLRETNFRPVGHLFYRAVEAAAGLRFAWYVAGVQVLHLIVTVVLWWLLRSLGFDAWQAAGGALVFLFHPAIRPAHWQPMWVFDVLCGLLSLLSLLAYMHHRWVWSFVLFWLAYKSKEVAVMLPPVLLMYELSLGERRWKRLLPFFAASAVFGIQAIVKRPVIGNEYRLVFSANTLKVTAPFYAEAAFGVAWLAALFPLAGFLIRDRRFWFGLAAAALMLTPVLFLPGRIFAVYTYVPLALLAVAVAAAAASSRVTRIATLPLILVLWLPYSYTRMLEYRQQALNGAAESRAYVETAVAYVRAHPEMQCFVLDGRPASMQFWGPTGAVRYATPIHEATVVYIDSEAASKCKGPVLRWDADKKRLDVTGNSPQ